VVEATKEGELKTFFISQGHVHYFKGFSLSATGAGISPRFFMHSTSPTLLERLKNPDDRAWTRFVELYSPLLFEWARRNRVPPGESADFVQDVFARLVREIPIFQVNPDGNFRAWLFIVVKNCASDRFRKLSRQPQLVGMTNTPAPAIDDPLIEVSDREYRDFLLRRILQLIRADFPAATWQIFQEHVLDGQSAAEVAVHHGITVNAVRLARGRILKRLRSELATFLDE